MKLAKVFLSLFMLYTFMSCGDSPFLNKSTDENQIQSPQRFESDLTFSNSNIQVKAYWRSGPNISEESSLLILLLDSNGVLTTQDFNLKLKLWMPTMGHGSFPVSIHKVSTGVYEATEIFFTMPGEWDIHFQFLSNTKLSEEVIWPLNL